MRSTKHPYAGRLGNGLGNTSPEQSYLMQRYPCVVSQACQHAWRAEQVRCSVTSRLRFTLVACSPLLPPLSLKQYISSTSAPQYLLPIHFPCPNTASSHMFFIHHLTTAPHQAMHQGNMPGLVQITLFQERLLIQELEGLPPHLYEEHSNPHNPD